MSWKTIEVHRANAMRKMQANSLSELVGMVLHLRAA
ncbi:LuxR C-terminal-related transcriptional regulator [Sulfuriferula plumbiphila]